MKALKPSDNEMMRAQTIYRRFIEFEEKAASIYLHMASHFSANRRLASFWFEMGMEEKQHAGLLQFCIAENLYASDLPNGDEIRHLQSVFRTLELGATSSDLTIDEAFVIATEVETSEVNAIYCHLTKPLHGSMYLLRRKIASFTPDHVGDVVQAARAFGVKQDTINKLDRLIRFVNRDSLRKKGA